jgi:hypothetical protein
MVRDDHSGGAAGWSFQPMKGGLTLRSFDCVNQPSQEATMYVVVNHQIKDPETAFARGDKLIRNEGAPAGARGLQFYPAVDGSAVTCLWEAESVEEIQAYADDVLGDSASNVCFEVNADQAFCDRPLGLAPSPRATA